MILEQLASETATKETKCVTIQGQRSAAFHCNIVTRQKQLSMNKLLADKLDKMFQQPNAGCSSYIIPRPLAFLAALETMDLTMYFRPHRWLRKISPEPKVN